MNSYSLLHLADDALLRDLAESVARDRTTTAELLARIAEVDARRLYLPAGYPSMFAFCVEELHLSEDSAYKRIRAARAAREFPVLFDAVADGRLHLSAVVVLAAHLTRDNLDELIGLATGKKKSEIEELLVQRFPQPELAPMVRALPARAPEPVASCQLAPGPVETPAPAPRPPK